MRYKSTISIVIVTYNSEKYIKNCLYSVFSSKFNLEIEVIIVDNNSRDNTVKVIHDTDYPIKIIENRENIGFARANNQALKIAQGKYVFILNPDTEISFNALNKFYQFMENSNNKNVWCAGGQLIDENGQPSKSFGKFPNIFDVFLEQFGVKGILLKIFGEKWLSRNQWIEKSIKVPFIMGCNMFIRKDLLEKIGYFNESFFLNYEEVELSWRAEKKGYISLVLPDVIIKHYSGKSFVSLHEYLSSLWLSQVIFFKLTRNKIYYSIIKLLHLFGALLRYIIKFDKNYLRQLKKIISV